jgi:RimJ/RimL family protein N-acetyltransferase
MYRYVYESKRILGILDYVYIYMSHIHITDHIYLAPIQESDLERLTSIANDIDISKNLKALPHPYTLADAQWWLVHTQEVAGSETEANRGIYIDGVYAGNCGRTRRNTTGKHAHNYAL